MRAGQPFLDKEALALLSGIHYKMQHFKPPSWPKMKLRLSTFNMHRKIGYRNLNNDTINFLPLITCMNERDSLNPFIPVTCSRKPAFFCPPTVLSPSLLLVLISSHSVFVAPTLERNQKPCAGQKEGPYGSQNVSLTHLSSRNQVQLEPDGKENWFQLCLKNHGFKLGAESWRFEKPHYDVFCLSLTFELLHKILSLSYFRNTRLPCGDNLV